MKPTTLFKPSLTLNIHGLIYAVFFSATLVSLSGCNDRFQEGYDKGFSEGVSHGMDVSEKSCEKKIEAEKRLCDAKSYSSGFSGGYSTEVCGGSGVNANGKHYDGGKTGCVRVHSDGRVERY